MSEATFNKGLALELEKLHMANTGKLTRMGSVAYDRLRQHRPSKK